MPEPADGERAAAVRETALCPALCPQSDTTAEGNLRKPWKGAGAVTEMGLHCLYLLSHHVLQELHLGTGRLG